MSHKSISIAIPTYNGEKTIGKTLNTITTQINKLPQDKKNLIEIVVSDDRSTDLTLNIVNEYSKKHNYINVFQNDMNLGMDLNFERAALRSKNDFIWFSGQDDFFEPRSLETLLSYIDKSDNIGLIVMNFDQIEPDSGKIISKGAFEKQHYINKKIDFYSKDYFRFSSIDEYFRYFKSVPTFLPSTIMKREYWSDFDSKKYLGTCYVQVGAIWENLHKGDIIVITKSFIKGSLPNDQWQSDGNKLFRILLGNLKMKTLVQKSANSNIPRRILRNDKRLFLLNLFFIIGHCKKIGLRENNIDMREDIKLIFHSRLTSNYVVSLLNMPWRIYKTFYFPLNFIKKSIYRPK